MDEHRALSAPVKVFLTPLGAEKTRLEYISREFDPVVNSKTVGELGNNLAKVTENLRSLGVYSQVNAYIERMTDHDRESLMSSDSKLSLSNESAIWTAVYVNATERKMDVSKVEASIDENEVAGKFSVSVPNCSGRFDTLTAHAQVGSPWAIDAGLTWSFPRFLGSKISAIFESGRRNENHVADSSYKLSAQGFSATFVPWFGQSVSYKMDWRDVIPEAQRPDERDDVDRGPSRSICMAAVPSVKSSVEYRFGRSSLDHPAVPKSGHEIHLATEFAGPGGDVSHVKGQVKARAVLPISSAMSFHTSVRSGLLYSFRKVGEFVNIPDRFFLGGTSSVRGFSRGEIGPRDRGDGIGSEVFFEGKAALEFDLPLASATKYGVRGSLFVNGGNGANFSDACENSTNFFKNVSSTAGFGLAMPLPILPNARAEVNCLVNLRSLKPKLQVGVGVDML